MHISRPHPRKCLIVAVTGILCQSGSALADEPPALLATYVSEQDQLCNYCQDYSANSVSAVGVTTLYQVGIGYPAPVPEEVAGMAEPLSQEPTN
ncbi:hypothetical protein R5H32_20450 [Defluviimonas sp. D31]|uniref:hypothetical protein n=1 Tax=Defluviimonas sp. D31 TaxID=3083253 RepID=UPI00296ED2BC|nr:hypothetical protein [Defluviimonas sp. D31]MDW4551700.1 hypothetical protein [Defluviimonas sp. D31]